MPQRRRHALPGVGREMAIWDPRPQISLQHCRNE